MTHVFIVNDRTLKIHLEYLFAGTGANFDAPFLLDSNYVNPRRKDDGVTSASERNITAMIADISRIRPNDKIIFYLQATNKHQGMFFGIFVATEKAFYQPNSDNYLNAELGKTLNFRVLIKPDLVYSKGITEHELLDNLNGINHPSEMCWSLIYRKLKGNRGCTMITDYESDRLISMLESYNQGQTLEGSNFTYSADNICIENIDSNHPYTGNRIPLDIGERIIYKFQHNHAFESHLQAYVMQHFDESPLKDLIANNCKWIGNEVSCGVGMQRIDSMFINETESEININIIELKCVVPYEEIVTNQLPWYVSWIEDYLVPTYNKKVIITPIILAHKFSADTETDSFKHLCNTFETIDTSKLKVNCIQFISFKIDNENILFNSEF